MIAPATWIICIDCRKKFASLYKDCLCKKCKERRKNQGTCETKKG